MRLVCSTIRVVVHAFSGYFEKSIDKKCIEYSEWYFTNLIGRGKFSLFRRRSRYSAKIDIYMCVCSRYYTR